MDEAARARIRELRAKAVVLSDGRKEYVSPEEFARRRARIRALPVEVLSDNGVFVGPDHPTAPDDVLHRCAALDHSDTDNGKRLVAHFGADLAVVERDGHAGGDFLAWTGKVWDFAGGPRLAVKLAQCVGDRILVEASCLEFSREERTAITAAAAFSATDKSPAASVAVTAAKEAEKDLERRRQARRKFGVSSKNKTRVNAMLDMAAPHLSRPSSSFNADPLKFAAQNATLRFVVEDDPECPDPDVTRKTARCDATHGHDRSDYLTGMVAADFDPAASAAKWQAFLDRCLPDKDVQRTLRAYSGMSLVAHLEQKLMFHYGSGANGKSVFLAVLGAVIGPSLGVALPKETILGVGERGAGQASPDLVRLFGKRLVRIDEIKEGEKTREDLIKRLTGGDTIVVRDLFKGYLEFPNVASPHMVGNGYPQIEGTDDGIWRRMLVMHWGVTIPEADRRPFDELVEDLLTERSGILNWLIAGVCDVLANGLIVDEASKAATNDFREDMDLVGAFAAACVRPRPGGRVQARTLYEAYKTWAMANAVSVWFETRFGRKAKKRWRRDEDVKSRFYLDIELHDVPDPAEPRRPAPQPRSGGKRGWRV